MPKSIMRAFELLLIVVVAASVMMGIGQGWGSTPSSAPDLAAQLQPQGTPSTEQLLGIETPTPVGGAIDLNAELAAAKTPLAAPTADATAVLIKPTPATPEPFKVDYSTVDANDAPLIEQAAGTLNFLLLGTDASANDKFARTDTLMVASVNPDLPSVSLLSFPRDMVVRIPGFGSDRINTVFERGYIANFEGGGPAFTALVLRKNFGIKIDHFVRIDFQGFIKMIDTLGGVEVLVECELHDTFPDKTSPTGKTDLDVFPGRVTLSGKQALWFSRSRWSTTDFDRARRQQKVMRAVLRKAKESNLFANAIGLFNDLRGNVETDIGLTDLPGLIDVAQRLTNLQIKSRVITFGIVAAHRRETDGASVLLPTDKTIPFIKEALSPPTGNQARLLPIVEVYNGSGNPDMEYIAAERLAWEGFNVIDIGKTPAPEFAQTQIFVFATTTKGNPVPRLADIFGVRSKNNIKNQLDPSSVSAARIVLGDDYNSCPATASIGTDVVLEAAQNKLLPTPTAAVAGAAP